MDDDQRKSKGRGSPDIKPHIKLTSSHVKNLVALGEGQIGYSILISVLSK